MSEEKNISRTYDYSTVIVDTNLVTYLVQLCEDAYKRLLKTTELEKEKNEKLKSEFQNYQYKKHYSMGLSIRAVEASNEYSSFEIKDFEHYNELLNNNKINNLKSFKIDLNLSFERGSGYETVIHKNEFEITLKPYDIKVSRISDFEDEGINSIENMIVNAFNDYPKVNTIFCSK